MSNPFEESFSRFILTGEVPSIEKMLQEIAEYEKEKSK